MVNFNYSLTMKLIRYILNTPYTLIGLVLALCPALKRSCSYPTRSCSTYAAYGGLIVSRTLGAGKFVRPTMATSYSWGHTQSRVILSTSSYM